MPPPIWISLERNRKKTGRIRFVERQVGRWKPARLVVLQIEEEFEWAQTQVPPADDAEYERHTSWRDAHALDLSSTALRWLIDGQPVA